MAALLSAATPPAHAGTIVSRPAADMTLYAGGRVQGGQRFLVVGGGRSARAYLRWQLPASAAAVVRARLELYTPTGGQGLRVHAGRASWSERSTTARAPRAFRLAGPLPAAKARSWLKLDVTRFVRGGGSVSFVVSKLGPAEARLTSREGPAALRPRLVLELNRAPLCRLGARPGTEDSRLTGRLQCEDDGALRYRRTGTPAHGTVDVSVNGEFTYTPEANFHGVDSFAFEACESASPGRCAGARMELGVESVNDAPTAGAVSATTAEDSPAQIDFRGSDVDGDSLTYSLASQPAHGSAAVSGSGATYTPAENRAGPDSFTYLVSDGKGGTVGALVSVNVTPVNDAPTAAEQTATTLEDTAKAIVLGAADVDEDPLVFTIVSGPAHGHLSGAGAERTYTPVAHHHGVDSFSFRVNDGATDSNVATVTLAVSPVNDPPVAEDQNAATPEDTAKALTLGAADVDGDPLAFTIVSAPTHGALSGAGADRTYTPDANYHGPDSFTYKLSDGMADSDVATVTLAIDAVNDAPIAASLDATTQEDTAKSLTLGAMDVDGDALSYEIVAGPAHGTLSGSGADRTYTPAQNSNGADSFTFRTSDGAASSNVATVTVTVTEVNDAPTAAPDAKSTAEDAALAFPAGDLAANDSKGPANESGQALTVSAVGGPVGGTVALSGGKVTFSPQANFNGEASFTYTVADDGQTGGIFDPKSATGIVTITVDPVNDVPVAANDHYVTPANSVLNVPARGVLGNDSDVEGSTLQAVRASGPGHGTLSLNADGSFAYTPPPGYNGRDSFTYTANDGTADSNVARVTIDVGNFTNRPPVALDRAETAAEDAARSITLSATDPDGDLLAYWIVAAPAHGSVVGSGADRTYRPDPDYNGPDSFTYKADDGTADSNVATVSLVVSEANDPPSAVADEKATAEDEPLRFAAADLVLNDAAGPPNEAAQALHVTGVGSPAGGTVELVGGEVTFVPAANLNGTASFSYTVADDGQTAGAADPRSAQGTVTVAVAPVNDPPVAQAGAGSVNEDESGTITLSASDVDGDPLAFTIVTPPAHGALSGTGPNRTYTPDVNYHGPDSFAYKAGDGMADSNVAMVALTVVAVNDAPVASDLAATAAEDTATPVTLTASDVDGDPLAYEIVSGPAHGLLSGTGANRTYVSGQDYNGPDSFTYKAGDGMADSNVATVTLSVDAVNDAPVAQDVSVTTSEDVEKAIALQATDVDTPALTFTIVSGPAHGTLVGSGAERTYRADPDYNGPDTFTYRAADGTADSNVATVSLAVAEANDPPTPALDEKATDEDSPLQFAAAELLANDARGPPNESDQALTVTGVGSPLGGTVELSAGDVTFTPAADFNGTASFSYTVADDGQTAGVADPRSAEGTVRVAVAPVNDRPVAQVGSGTANEDESAAVTLPATDVDGDALSYSVVLPPSHGSLTPPVGDQVTYTPDTNYHGPDSFKFIATDDSSDSDLGIVFVDVTSINDAPVLDASGSPQLTPVNANAINPVGDTVAELLASGAGGDPVSDVDGDSVGIAVTAVDESGGAWQYRTAGGAWSPLAGAGDSAARLLDADSKLRFVPAPGFSGEATVQFRAWDQTSGLLGDTADASSAGGSSPFSAAHEVATITVIANSLPAAVDDATTTTEDVSVSIAVLANDSDLDGDPLTLSEVTAPQDGKATIVGGDVLYVPDPNTNGTDQFTYTVRDPSGGSASAKVSVTVAAENDVPIARDDVEFVSEDGFVVFDPTGNDVAGPLEESGGPLTLSPVITGAPQSGTASIPSTGPDAGRIHYAPNTNFAGSDILMYEVCDDGTPALCSEAVVNLTVSRVAATVETAPVTHAAGSSRDSADDAAIWVNPADPSQSVVIGSNKFSDATTNGGLAVYDLAGNQLDYTNNGRMNNVDVRSGFPLAGAEATLVTATERNGGNLAISPKRIWIYKLDHGSRTLAAVHSGTFAAAFEPLGACMYRSPTSGDFFVFVTGAVGGSGFVEQWRLSEAAGGGGLVDAAKVRTIVVGAGSGDVAEGCVADDRLGHLYVAEEDVGIWKYSAEPTGGETRTQVDVAGGGHVTADIEGLTIAYGPGTTGYLIASSQGSSSYAVYRRDGNNAFVRSFKIKAGGGGQDAVTATDGIDVTSASLGPAFPNGVFVAQDNLNTPDNQNFKLVPLEQIVQTAGLGSNGSCARPYADSSPWNMPIPADAGLNPDSATHVAAIGGPLTSSPAQFTFPVYLVDDSTPRRTVTLTGWFSNVTNGGRTLANQREGTAQIPIPTGAVPAAGSDAQIIMVDPLTGDEWGFSRATRDEATGSWTGWNAYHYSTRWSGVPPYDATGRPFVPRGAGLPYLAGLVRPCEVERGRIDHALAFAYDFPTKDFVYPASKSDGNGAGPPDMPEGSRLQLDPALTESDLATLGCTGHCLTIARALQVYGMYIIDNSGRPKVMLEFEGTAGWGGAVTAETVSPIPLSAFRLLQS